MLRVYTIFSVLICWAVLTSGCLPEEAQVEVEGQVFVLAPDGDSVPLSLVRVRVFERDAMVAFLNRREEEIAARTEEMRGREEELRNRLAAAEEARDAMAERYRERLAEIEREAAELSEETDRRIDEYREQIRSNESFVIDLDGTPQAPEGIPSPEEYRAFQERRERWFSMSRAEREAWREVLMQQTGELVQAIETAREDRAERVGAWDAEVESLRAELGDSETEFAEAERELNEAVEAHSRYPSTATFFEDLPPATTEIRTDADGAFVLRLPEKPAVALLGLVDREVRGRREEHGWFVWVDPAAHTGRKVLLSNHNSISMGEDPADLLPGGDVGGQDR